VDLDLRLPRHVRLDADRTARPGGLLLRRGGERMLFDCAEGTQRQLLRSNVGLLELREVFLTHYHADHYLGLPGMLKTFALRGREVPITIYGPPGLRDLFDALRRIFGRLTYTVELKELRPGDELIREDYRLVTSRSRTACRRSATRSSRTHGRALRRPGRGRARGAVGPGARGAPARRVGHARGRNDDHARPVLGPARPGRKVVIAGDGGPAESVIEAARNADVLVHEATFCEDERERARETQHSTAHEAAGVARAAEVELLALTHLSNRYFGGEVAREARTLSRTRSCRRTSIRSTSASRSAAGRCSRRAARSPRRGETEAVRPARRHRNDRMVQVAMAGDVTEAEELQTILRSAGIDSELEVRASSTIRSGPRTCRRR
jgi:ribonuclease Z